MPKMSTNLPDTIEPILKCQTVDDLKAYGAGMKTLIAHLRKLVRKKYGERIRLQPGMGWKGVLELLPALRDLFEAEIKTGLQNKSSSFSGSPFVSEEARLIYVLTELDGESRAKELGITSDVFHNSDKAKHWKNSIYKVIHPDKCKHPMSLKAAQVLEDLYGRITN